MPDSSVGKESACNAGDPGSIPGSEPESCSALVAQLVKNPACNVGDLGSIPGLERSPGRGNGNPLQYSCLENSMAEDPGRCQSVGSQRVGHD